MKTNYTFIQDHEHNYIFFKVDIFIQKNQHIVSIRNIKESVYKLKNETDDFNIHLTQNLYHNINRNQQIHSFSVNSNSEKQFAWKYPDKSQEILLLFELRHKGVQIVDQNKEKEEINDHQIYYLNRNGKVPVNTNSMRQKIIILFKLSNNKGLKVKIKQKL